jgi:large subunit ribosomal protein L10
VPRAEKKAKVKELAEQLSEAPAAVLAGYRGLTVQEAAELRTALAEVDTRFSVVKNSLVKLAAEQAGRAALVELIDGPTAVAFIRGDLVAAAKRMVEQARRFPVLEFRGGFAEGRVLTGDDVKTLAALEPREVMLAKIAGLGRMQMSRAAWMFQALQSRFVGLMHALQDKLPGEALEAEATPETAAEPEEPKAEIEEQERESPALEEKETPTEEEGGAGEQKDTEPEPQPAEEKRDEEGATEGGA